MTTPRFLAEVTVVMVDDATFTSCTDRLSMMCLDPSHRMFGVKRSRSQYGGGGVQAPALDAVVEFRLGLYWRMLSVVH